LKLKPNQALVHDDYLIAIHLNEGDIDDLENAENIEDIETNTLHLKIENLWDIFLKNGDAIVEDYKLLTKGRKSIKVSETNTLINQEHIFIENGAKLECAVLNATDGPIYIGADAEIMEGSVIRGPFALCEHSTVKMGAKIYGPTTIGPYSKVGGELNNCVIFGYSSKAHDGFLGNSVIGEWCNIGADSNNSNLKNNYGEVKLWNYPEKRFVGTGLQFCGLIMGDHSKCGINTMFNTGTVVGVSANIYGHGFQRNFIASFSWGSSSAGFQTFDISKALEIAERVYERRNKPFDEKDKNILRSIFKLTREYRFL
jgi:UDP-N-acetylglucosamine diphosphorylase/glucosamine-1-phosphate N-acetyltransferase